MSNTFDIPAQQRRMVFMKAMIMAAGIGTRLRPLTYSVPKPMMPLANRPVLEYTLQLLKKHNITEVTINLYTAPEMITGYFGDGSSLGMKINYSVEKELMGTAGGVKKVEDFFGETFLVMSGDGLTDINLTEVIEFHRQKKALGTMVLKEVDTRFEYGVTMVDNENRIEKFVEKPNWGDVFCNTVNTGIYVFQKEIFNFMPANKFYDFGHDLWPLLLEKGEKIFGYLREEYWCDIGNLNEYKKAQQSILEGKVEICLSGEKYAENVWVGKETKIDKTAQITGPCLIGKKCQIEKNVCLGPGTTIGDYSVIKEGAILNNCILWNNVCIDKNVELKNCILGDYTHISGEISVFNGVVINGEEKEKRK